MFCKRWERIDLMSRHWADGGEQHWSLPSVTQVSIDDNIWRQRTVNMAPVINDGGKTLRKWREKSFKGPGRQIKSWTDGP